MCMCTCMYVCFERDILWNVILHVYLSLSLSHYYWRTVQWFLWVQWSKSLSITVAFDRLNTSMPSTSLSAQSQWSLQHHSLHDSALIRHLPARLYSWLNLLYLLIYLFIYVCICFSIYLFLSLCWFHSAFLVSFSTSWSKKKYNLRIDNVQLHTIMFPLLILIWIKPAMLYWNVHRHFIFTTM